MVFSRYSRLLDRTRVLQAVGLILAAGVLLAALGQPTPAAAATTTGRAQVPRSPHDDGSGALALSSAAVRSLTDGAFAPVTGDVSASSGISAAAEISLPSEGYYYWSGEYLCVDGYVWNNTASAVGPVAVEIMVQTLGGGTTLADDAIYAHAYRVLPDEDASFIHVIYLPAHVGSEMDVYVGAWGMSPTAITAVDLTYLSGSYVVDVDGTRIWTCYFKNNSSVAVKAPVVGGWEFNADGDVYDSLFGFEQTTQVPPGGTLEIEAYGALPGVSPVNVYTYCQALAVPKPVYRFYNSRLGTHFYTASEAEKENVKATLSHIFTFEGPAYYMNPVANTQPLHRFYLKASGTHFYTANEAEKAKVINTLSHVYAYEGPAYNVSSAPGAGRTTVYRFYHRTNGTHFYTANESEKVYVQNSLSHVYQFEGQAFWIGQ